MLSCGVDTWLCSHFNTSVTVSEKHTCSKVPYLKSLEERKKKKNSRRIPLNLSAFEWSWLCSVFFSFFSSFYPTWETCPLIILLISPSTYLRWANLRDIKVQLTYKRSHYSFKLSFNDTGLNMMLTWLLIFLAFVIYIYIYIHMWLYFSVFVVYACS